MKIQVNGVSLNTQELGVSADAIPTLVFLHYFAGSSRAWLPVMDRLADRFHCVAPDLHGFGDSEAPATGYAVADYADDIAALIGALGVEHFVLVGHSMGGKIALALAARQPLGLASLIFLAPSPPTPEPMEDAERQRLLCSQSRRPEAEETVRKILARPLPDPLFAQAVEDSLKSSQPAWSAWLQNGSREDISAQMPCIVVPVLVAAGEADLVLPSELLQREVLARFAKGQMAILPGSGHLSPLEVASSVADLIVRTIEYGF